MNTEIMLWIVTFFIVWEILYIIGIKRGWFDSEWIVIKIMTFPIAAMFMATQGLITNQMFDGNARYERLLYEVGIIIFLFLFFKINEWLYNQIVKEDK